MQTYYYPKTIENVTIALSDMFNNLVIKKYDKNGAVVKSVNVPIKFGPVEKTQQMRARDESGQRYYISLPSMALVLNGISYDQTRATGVNEERNFYSVETPLSATDEFTKDIQPTPYNYSYTLNVRTESMSDFAQILENILPYFNPTLYLRVKEFSFLNIERDLPVTLDTVTLEFVDDMDDNAMRHLNAAISLTVKGWMYRPIETQKVIHSIHSRFIVSEYASTEILSGGQVTGYTINVSGDTSGVSYL